MTVLATKLAALKDVRVARAAIKALMVPQPEATATLLRTTATQRLTTAAELLAKADTKRPLGGIIEALEGAIAALAAHPDDLTFATKHQASVMARTASKLIRHEPDVAAHLTARSAARSELLGSVFRASTGISR